MSRDRNHTAAAPPNDDSSNECSDEDIKNTYPIRDIQQPENHQPNLENATDRLQKHPQKRLREEIVQVLEEESPTRTKELQMMLTNTVTILVPYEKQDGQLKGEREVHSSDEPDQKDASGNCNTKPKAEMQEISSPRQYACDMRRQANEESGIDDPLTHTGYDQIDTLETIVEEDEKSGGG